MKDNYNGVNMATWKMLEAFNVFTQAMQETLRPQMEEEYSFGSDEESSEDEMEGKLIASSDEGEEEYGCDEFPGRPYFSMEDIDSEDPAFAFGKEIGIPKDVAIYNSPRQNKFIGMI